MRQTATAALVLAVLPGVSSGQLTLVQRIPLPGVDGRIDHMAVDVSGKRLFVAGLGNNTLEVVDLQAGKRLHSVQGLKEPQGVAFVPVLNRIFVTNGQRGDVTALDGRDYQTLKQIPVGDDPDNVRFDRANHRLIVGFGSGGLQFIEPKDLRTGEVIRFDGHPEGFQLTSDGARCYVNVPDGRRIDVCDVSKPKPVASWSLGGPAANFPMALDEAHHRLFVGCRQPARLLVFDTASGKRVAELEVGGDTDDVFYDAASRRIYVSCGAGEVGVLRQDDADHYELTERVKTAPGARTSFFVAELGRLYVAVPHRGNQPAEILVFQTT